MQSDNGSKKRLKDRFKDRILFIITIFLLMNAFFIVSNKNISLNSTQNLQELVISYATWIGNLGKGFFSFNGNVIKENIIPKT